VRRAGAAPGPSGEPVHRAQGLRAWRRGRWVGHAGAAAAPGDHGRGSGARRPRKAPIARRLTRTCAQRWTQWLAQGHITVAALEELMSSSEALGHCLGVQRSRLQRLGRSRTAERRPALTRPIRRAESASVAMAAVRAMSVSLQRSREDDGQVYYSAQPHHLHPSVAALATEAGAPAAELVLGSARLRYLLSCLVGPAAAAATLVRYARKSGRRERTTLTAQPVGSLPYRQAATPRRSPRA
jgi:hypothetical protein